MMTVKMDVFVYIIAPFATGIYLNIELLQQIGKEENASYRIYLENLIKKYRENITKTLDKNNHISIKTAGKIYEEIRTNIFSDEQDYSKGFISIEIEDPVLSERLSIGKTKVSFINKHGNFFASGIGLFLLKVRVEFQDNNVDIIYLKDILEKKIDEEINFKLIEVKNFNNTLNKLLSGKIDIPHFFQKRKMSLILIMVLTFLILIQNFHGYTEFIVFVIMKNYSKRQKEKTFLMKITINI